MLVELCLERAISFLRFDSLEEEEEPMVSQGFSIGVEVEDS